MYTNLPKESKMCAYAAWWNARLWQPANAHGVVGGTRAGGRLLLDLGERAAVPLEDVVRVDAEKGGES